MDSTFIHDPKKKKSVMAVKHKINSKLTDLGDMSIADKKYLNNFLAGQCCRKAIYY